MLKQGKKYSPLISLFICEDGIGIPKNLFTYFGDKPKEIFRGNF
jgi:hypothetical protein